MAGAPGGYDQAGPTLGQDSDWVLRDVLGCTEAEIESLSAAGAVE
jgi:crotonobetainyl-CoA:carnitine CoA-transferase CaiB-like acyl-CoA transferase